MGDYVITVEEYFLDDTGDKHFSISFTKRGGFQSIRKTVNNLSTKEFLEAKLKLIESKARYEENMLNDLLKLTGSTTLNNQMDSLLEETEYEKEHKKHE